MIAPMLHTERLILRRPEAGDWAAYRDYRRSARSTMAPLDDSMIWTQFAAFFGHWILRGFGRFIVTLRETGAAIGHAGPFRPEGNPENELTWTLWRAGDEGKGLAYEAAKASHDHAFGDLGWATAVSYIAPENTRSIALACRLGAVLDATADQPSYAPALVYRHRKGARP